MRWRDSNIFRFPIGHPPRASQLSYCYGVKVVVVVDIIRNQIAKDEKKIHRKNNNFKQTWNRIEWAKWKGKKKRWNINELHDGSLEHFLIHFQFNLRTRDAIGADTRWQCSGTRKLLMLMEIKIHKVRHMWFSYVLRYFAFLLSVSLSLSNSSYLSLALWLPLSDICTRREWQKAAASLWWQ